MRQVVALLIALLAAPPGRLASRPAASGTNVLLITIDTLRRDRLGCYGSTVVSTPAVDALAARGVLFESAYAHDPITLASHANIMTGTTSLVHGIGSNAPARVPEAARTLAEHLKARGYATAAFLGSFALDSRFGLAQGFDVYDDTFPARPRDLLGAAERQAGDVIAAARVWLAKQSRPWLCWIHLWDPHAPYMPPEPYLSRFRDDPYSGEVAYVDEEIGKLLTGLGTETLTRTVIALTADHGESLGEHGEATHGLFAYNSTIAVPLVIAAPGIAARRIREPVGHIDLLPTICDLLDVAAPPGLQGRSLAPVLRGRSLDPRPVYIESLDPYINKGCAPLRGVIVWPHKYLRSPLPELYDLGSDPGETRNLAAEADLAPYERTLQSIEAAARPLGRASDRAGLDAETRERLRSLGYVVSAQGSRRSAFGPADDVKRFLPLQQKLERAILGLGAGRADENLALLAEIVEMRPDFGEAFVTYVQASARLGRLDEALRVADATFRRRPEDLSVLTAYGTLLIQAGRFDPAVGILERASVLAPEDPVVWDRIGVAEWRRGGIEKALERFAKAISLDPSFAAAYANRGALWMSVYEDRGRSAEVLARAAADFRRAAELDPASGLAWRGLGVAERSAGRLEAALSAWERAAAADPDDAFSAFHLGETLLAVGRKAEARRWLERYLEIKGDRITPAERTAAFSLIEKAKREPPSRSRPTSPRGGGSERARAS